MTACGGKAINAPFLESMRKSRLDGIRRTKTSVGFESTRMSISFERVTNPSGGRIQNGAGAIKLPNSAVKQF